jgi:hypothetical protein
MFAPQCLKKFKLSRLEFNCFKLLQPTTVEIILGLDKTQEIDHFDS